MGLYHGLNTTVQSLIKLTALGIIILTTIWAINTKAKAWTNSRKRRAQPKEVAPFPEKPPTIEPLEGFDWKTAERRKLRPFKPIYHITMAIRADTPSELITMDQDYLDRVTLRRRLIAQHGNTVHGCTPAGESAVRELYMYLLTEHLPIRFPTMFKLSSDKSTFENLITNKTFPTMPSGDMKSALRVLGETVEEDLFLLQQMPEGHGSVAFMCCFPSGFDPSEKLGKTLLEIHAPVPSYEKIGASMERFFARLEVGKGVKRVNWSVQTHTDLFNCKGNHITGDDKIEVDEPIVIEKTFLRIELQTLTRLPKTNAILFSFKTYLYPVRDLKEEGLGPDFADAIEGLQKGNAPGMWTYKSAVRWGRSVCEYLRS
ncbi:Fc.00g095130.m01.CDS01 [Cosmosporella sp. VM-42]